MVRNCADHGLETPAERLTAGKGEQGTLRVSANHEGGHIIICTSVAFQVVTADCLPSSQPSRSLPSGQAAPAQ